MRERESRELRSWSGGSRFWTKRQVSTDRELSEQRVKFQSSKAGKQTWTPG